LKNKEFLEQVLDGLKLSGVKVGSKVIIAFSGGPDSTALLLSLTNLQERFPLTLIAAHLNHMTRGKESQKDEEFTKFISQRSGVPYRSKKINLKSIIEKGQSFEELARLVRYEYLQEIEKEHGATGVLTGHTKNDQAETVLLNLVRGSGIRGTSGMKPYTSLQLKAGQIVHIFRPILKINHGECVDFCESMGVKPVYDSTNSDKSFVRNKIRLETLPQIEQQFPNIINKLSSFAENSKLDLNVIDWAIRKHYKLSKHPDLTLKKRYLSSLPDSLITGIVNHHVQMLGIKINLLKSHRIQISKLITSNTTGQINLPDGVKFFVGHDYVKIIEKGTDDCPYPLPLDETVDIFHNETQLGSNHIVITELRKRPKTLSVTNPKIEVYIRHNLINNKLQIRNQITGDRFHPLGMKTEVYLKHFMIKHFIPHPWRKRVPLLLCRTGIAWVPGTRPADWAKVLRDDDKVLHIEIKNTSVIV
jgi:tRNA(Ile)-lysidine synthase